MKVPVSFLKYGIRGMKAEKHVQCEKPYAASVAQAEQTIAATREA